MRPTGRVRNGSPSAKRGSFFEAAVGGAATTPLTYARLKAGNGFSTSISAFGISSFAGSVGCGDAGGEGFFSRSTNDASRDRPSRRRPSSPATLMRTWPDPLGPKAHPGPTCTHSSRKSRSAKRAAIQAEASNWYPEEIAAGRTVRFEAHAAQTFNCVVALTAQAVELVGEVVIHFIESACRGLLADDRNEGRAQILGEAARTDKVARSGEPSHTQRPQAELLRHRAGREDAPIRAGQFAEALAASIEPETREGFINIDEHVVGGRNPGDVIEFLVSQNTAGGIAGIGQDEHGRAAHGGFKFAYRVAAAAILGPGRHPAHRRAARLHPEKEKRRGGVEKTRRDRRD